MKTVRIFLLSVLLAGTLHAQDGIGFGVGMSYDFNVDLPKGTPYTPLGNGQTSLYTFTASLRIPVKRIFNIYPTFNYSIPARNNLVTNPEGDYIPEGYIVKLPYDDGPDWSPVYYSDSYYDMHSSAEVWQKSYGAFFTVGRDFEIGSGIFLRDKRTDYYHTVYTDEYHYGDSDGMVWDNYYYSDTWVEGYEVESAREKLLAFPLMAKYSLQWNWWYNSGAFVYWLGTDRYISFVYTTGFRF